MAPPPTAGASHPLPFSAAQVLAPPHGTGGVWNPVSGSFVFPIPMWVIVSENHRQTTAALLCNMGSTTRPVIAPDAEGCHTVP